MIRDNQQPTPFQKDQGKDKHFKAQLKRFVAYLQNHIATSAMASVATGIPLKNICRYKRDLELQGKLFEVNKAICKHTGFKAWYLTTNKDLLNSQTPKP